MLTNRAFVYALRPKAWTTLDDNDEDLQLLSALAYQKSPGGAKPRLLFGGGDRAHLQYEGWNSLAAYLELRAEYQPVYGADPLTSKQWIWCDFLFPARDAAVQLTPVWNAVAFAAPIDCELNDLGAYARAFAVQDGALAHTTSVGLIIAAGAHQASFFGLSIAVQEYGNQSKRR